MWKIIIAYALVVVRVPNLVGTLLGMVLTLPINFAVRLSRRGTETPFDAAKAVTEEPAAWMSGRRADMATRDYFAHACHDVMSGLGAVFVAALLFHWLQVPLRVWVLLIMVVWEVAFYRELWTSTPSAI